MIYRLLLASIRSIAKASSLAEISLAVPLTLMRGLYSNRIATTSLARNLESPVDQQITVQFKPCLLTLYHKNEHSVRKDIVIAVDKDSRRLT